MAATASGTRLLARRQPTAASSPSATRTSTDPPAAIRLDEADRRHGRRPRPATATGSSQPTAASSPSATRTSTARPAAACSRSRSSAWRDRERRRATGSSRADGGVFTFGHGALLRFGGRRDRPGRAASGSRRRPEARLLDRVPVGRASTPRRPTGCTSTRTSCRRTGVEAIAIELITASTPNARARGLHHADASTPLLQSYAAGVGALASRATGPLRAPEPRRPASATAASSKPARTCSRQRAAGDATPAPRTSR